MFIHLLLLNCSFQYSCILPSILSSSFFCYLFIFAAGAEFSCPGSSSADGMLVGHGILGAATFGGGVTFGILRYMHRVGSDKQHH